jgi:1-acyl-sn-glycerol-3-phosphate acyltransferase
MTPQPEEVSDVEALADAMLSVIEEDVDQDQETKGVPQGLLSAVAVGQRLGIDFVHRYNRLEIDGALKAPAEPTLFVANHGFGGIFDLNVFAIFAAFDQLNLDRRVTILTHQIAWTLQVGPLIEQFGATPASRGAALAAFERGEHVLVLPGGDLDAFKPWDKRDEIVFEGRTGFARLAIDAGVPIMPIVTAGAGESAYVISDGHRLARALRLDRMLRAKVLPVSVSLPWGLNVGAAGVLPYLPLPTKLLTAVMSPIRAAEGETPVDLASRVEVAMQERLTDLALQRKASD